MNDNHLIGHKNILLELKNLYKLKKLPNKLLLSGFGGIGKRIVVNELLNFIYDSENSSTLIYKKTHPNIFFLKKKENSKIIDIDNVREMIKFQNQSSFNNKLRTVVVEYVDDMNLNASNAFLKCLEEPNFNTLFALIHNKENSILDTIKSRCIEFKMTLKPSETKQIVINKFNNDIFEDLSDDFINDYSTPGFVVSLNNFFNENNINITDVDIETLFKTIIDKKYYNSDNFVKQNLNYLIELFFYKNIRKKIFSYRTKNYFFKKLSDFRKYNLDYETFFLEFNEKLLNG